LTTENRIFIVGNGKSLKVSDLDLIVGEPSIACNRINLIYSRTKWRPSIYIHIESVVPDWKYVQENIDNGAECYIGEHYACYPVGALGLIDANAAPKNVHFIKECHHHLVNFDNPDVLDEWHLPQLCSFGGSVNMAMQIAVLKGFDEITLLGCDLEYKDGKTKQDHFDPNYKHGQEQPAFYASRNALYAHLQTLNTIRRKSLNVRIYNATDGGLLELWPRRTLTDILSGKRVKSQENQP